MSQRILATGPKEFNYDRFSVGINEDLEMFIYSVFDEFDEQQEPRFTFFCKVWKESKIGLIFCGRESFRETYEITEHILQRIKRYTKPNLENKKNNILIRYAAIYSLYSFFFKQPCRPMVRIKLGYEEFLELEGLIEEARNDLHYDVIYAWSKLLSNHAFQYSVVSRNYGIDVARRMEKTDKSTTLETYSSNSYLKSKEFRGMMRRLSKAHVKYTKMKVAVLKERKDDLIQLNSISDDIIETIEEIANEESKASLMESALLCPPGPSEIGNKRKRLKEKYFADGASQESSSNVQSSQEEQEVPEDSQFNTKRKGNKGKGRSRGKGKRRGTNSRGRKRH